MYVKAGMSAFGVVLFWPCQKTQHFIPSTWLCMMILNVEMFVLYFPIFPPGCFERKNCWAGGCWYISLKIAVETIIYSKHNKYYSFLHLERRFFSYSQPVFSVDMISSIYHKAKNYPGICWMNTECFLLLWYI